MDEQDGTSKLNPLSRPLLRSDSQGEAASRNSYESQSKLLSDVPKQGQRVFSVSKPILVELVKGIEATIRYAEHIQSSIKSMDPLVVDPGTRVELLNALGEAESVEKGLRTIYRRVAPEAFRE